MMLALFPDLFSFSLAAPLVIRIFLGVFFLLYALQTFAHGGAGTNTPRAYARGGAACVGGILVLIGLFTQGAALALSLVSLYEVWRGNNKMLHVLSFGMALSLLLSGAGFFAFDLPL